jgi:hypothetical protein
MIQTNISKIQYYGQKNERRNWNFRSFLKGLDMDETKVDAIIHEIYQDIVSQIDCKSSVIVLTSLNLKSAARMNNRA